MTNYLLNRKQRVIINGENSEWSTVKSGVPQGATLGLLSSLLFVNDRPTTLSIGTECGIFADDTKILRNITSNNDLLILQEDLNRLYDWSIQWGLRFNSSKCVVLTARRSQTVDHLNPPNYTLNDAPLHSSTEMQDLGVTVDSRLTWSKHMQ